MVEIILFALLFIIVLLGADMIMAIKENNRLLEKIKGQLWYMQYEHERDKKLEEQRRQNKEMDEEMKRRKSVYGNKD